MEDRIISVLQEYRDMVCHMVRYAHQVGTLKEFWLDDDERFMEIIKLHMPDIYEDLTQ